MILVTTGTSREPFDRLFEAIDKLDPKEPIVAQYGASKVQPSIALCVDYFTYEELCDHIRRARVVVTHAGVGSVLTALAHGKRPVVLPRLKRFGEAVDDHQLDFARPAADAGLLTLIEDVRDLPRALADVPSGSALDSVAGRALAGELRSFLAEKLGTSS